MNGATNLTTSVLIMSHSASKILDTQNWQTIEDNLNERGYAVIRSVLDQMQCIELIAQYQSDAAFRKRVVMERHGFGRGEYKYFSYPLPGSVESIRVKLYQCLEPMANRWNNAMKINTHYPADYQDYLSECHAAGQVLPTPLMLKYRSDDYNCLHQDLYGEYFFPLQMAVLLSRPQVDFTGGEFVITEQRPRMQSRVEVVPLDQGDAVIFAVNHKPVKGIKGIYLVNLRHGVSRVLSGQRHALGIILHDAKS